jgi:hypothetical protein
MKTPQDTPDPMQMENPETETEPLRETGEIKAWEPMEGNLWIPFRIRGSWRGGVLG